MVCISNARTRPGTRCARLRVVAWLLVTFVLLCIDGVQGADLPRFSCDHEQDLQPWGSRQNVDLAWTPEAPVDGAGALRVTIDAERNRFGWIRLALPEVDYTGLAGIELFFRAPEQLMGTLEIRLVRLREKGPRSVYAAEAGRLTDSRGEWLPAYVDLADLKHIMGPDEPPLPARLGPAWRLLLAFSTAGQTQPTIDVDEMTFVAEKDAEAKRERARQEHRKRMILPPQDVRSTHPSIVLTTQYVESRLEFLTAHADGAAALERLRNDAEAVLRGPHPTDPLRSVREWRESTQAKGDALTLGYAGRLRNASFPVELLAAVYRLDASADLGATAAQALANLARDVTIDDLVMTGGGRRMLKSFVWRTMALGYDWLYDQLTPEQRQLIQTRLIGYIERVHAESQTGGWGARPLYRVWNWDPGIMASLGLATLALEGETRLSEEWILFDCRRHIADYLTTGIDEDGCGHEGVNYFDYGMDSTVYVIETLRQQGREDLFTQTHYQLIPPWLASDMLPDGNRWNNLSDCTHAQKPSAGLMYACRRLAELAEDSTIRPEERWPANATRHRPDYLAQFRETQGPRPIGYAALAGLMGWVWETGPGTRAIDQYSPGQILAYTLFFKPSPSIENPATIMPLGTHFRGRGLVVSRTGFGPNALHLAVEAGPHAAGHDQSDKGTFTLRAYGNDLAIDSGYGNDGDPKGSTSSFAHNVVLVDGQGQPMGHHNQSDGYITGFHHDRWLDWIRVDATPAWTMRRGRNGEPIATGRMERAERTLLLVRPDQGTPSYIVVYDDIVKDRQNHTYTWQWHIPPGQMFDIDAHRWRTVTRNVKIPVLTSTAQTAGASATFTVEVPEPGAYILYGLTRAAGDMRGKSDSFFVTVDGGRRLTWDIPSNQYLGWAPVKDREDDAARILTLSEGTHEILLEQRETEAEWAAWMLLGADRAPPTEPDQIPDEGIMLSVEDATPGETAFVRRNPEPGMEGIPMMDVYPLHPTDGHVDTDWYLTSREGSHPRLQYTVDHTRPRLLFLMLPRNADTPEPVVTPFATADSIGLRVDWPGEIADWILFGNGTAECGPVKHSGAAARVRTENGNPTTWTLLDGNDLAFGEQILIQGPRKVLRSGQADPRQQ